MSVETPGMYGLERIRTIRAYCDYLEMHLLNVAKAWTILQDALPHEKEVWDDFAFWVTHNMVREHDLSKMDAAEFTAFAEWFFGQFGRNYVICADDSEGEEKHRTAKAAFDSAREHHKAQEPHHWENWTKAGQRFPGEASCHLMCMVADWMAMGMAFGDTAEEYYEREKSKIDLPEWAVKYLQRIFAALRNNTENGNG